MSEKSFSSGDGNYDDVDSDLSKDSDLATLKILTREGAAKRQVQIDLNRVKHRETYGDQENHSAEKIVKNELEGEKDDLREETLAQYAAIEAGEIDLYKRAMQISKRQAKKIVAQRQGEKSELNNKDDIIADLTEDEEITQELRDLATGKLKLS